LEHVDWGEDLADGGDLAAPPQNVVSDWDVEPKVPSDHEEDEEEGDSEFSRMEIDPP
jgi:hypothetical protein